MRRRLLATLVLAAAHVAQAQQPLAIRDATVIDGTGAAPREHQTVLIKGDRIWRVGPASIAVPKDARVVDGRGLFVLPGFIDMHAHYTVGPVTFDTTQRPPKMSMRYEHDSAIEMLQTLLAFGITTIRNPAGSAEGSVALRDSVRLGLRKGPRIFTAGEVLDLSASEGLGVGVTTEAEVRAEVDRQAALGVDYIKLYARLGPNLIRAAIDQAHRRGVRAVGHLFLTSWTDAAKAGIDGLIHITPGNGMLLPADRRAAYLQSFRGTQFMLEWFDYVDLASPEIREMTQAILEHNVFLDPTLVTFEAIAWGDSTRITRSPDLELAPTSLVDGWRTFDLTFGWKPDDYTKARHAWPQVLAFTRYLYDEGVQLTAGTDMANPWTVPGASFHRELELLVSAGIPPLQVLRIATRNGARSLGIESEVGTIAPGKVADLVLLTADPSADIRNTRKIAWVMQGGRLSRPRALLPPRLAQTDRVQ